MQFGKFSRKQANYIAFKGLSHEWQEKRRRKHPKQQFMTTMTSRNGWRKTQIKGQNNEISPYFSTQKIWSCQSYESVSHKSLRPFWPVVPVFERIRLKFQNQANLYIFQGRNVKSRPTSHKGVSDYHFAKFCNKKTHEIENILGHRGRLAPV